MTKIAIILDLEDCESTDYDETPSALSAFWGMINKMRMDK